MPGRRAAGEGGDHRRSGGWLSRFGKILAVVSRRDGMRELGYSEGQNIRYEFRSDQGEASRLPDLAAELVQLKVDVIVPWFTPATRAAKQATRQIPIVCALCGDLVGTGLVESLARPGGNVTGSSSLTAELSGKICELIRQMVPSAH